MAKGYALSTEAERAAYTGAPFVPLSTLVGLVTTNGVNVLPPPVGNLNRSASLYGLYVNTGTGQSETRTEARFHETSAAFLSAFQTFRQQGGLVLAWVNGVIDPQLRNGNPNPNRFDLSDPAMRTQIVEGCARLVADHGFDGVVLDIEELAGRNFEASDPAHEPARAPEMQGFVSLVVELDRRLEDTGGILAVHAPSVRTDQAQSS